MFPHMIKLTDKIKSVLTRKMKAPNEFERINITINRRLLSPILDKMRILGHEALILDSGCGTGENSIDIELQYPGKFRLLALDIHLPTLRSCRDQFSALAGCHYSIMQGNSIELPFRDSVINIVISNQVLEHVADYEKYIAEMARVLKEDGYLIISTPNAHCPRNTFLRMLGQHPVLRWPNLRNLPPEQFRGHIKEFTEDEIESLTNEHGFALIKSIPITPQPTFRGNWLFNLYSISETLFYWLTKSIVKRNYSKNINVLLQKLP
jgi:ubiquinone/menaquinone biosynthesis C-methylase UbiE